MLAKLPLPWMYFCINIIFIALANLRCQYQLPVNENSHDQSLSIFDVKVHNNIVALVGTKQSDCAFFHVLSSKQLWQNIGI